MINDYVSIDLETTGLDPKKDKIIEIGAVKVRNGIIIDTFETFVNPSRRLDEKITQITGITNDDLKMAKEPEVAIKELLSFIGEDMLLGHCIRFDYAFIKRLAVNRGYTFEKKAMDTLLISRRYLKELESRKLCDLCSYYKIHHHAHRALADATATHELFLKLKEDFLVDETGNIQEGFEPFVLVYKVKKEGPITIPQKERLVRLIEKHKMVLELDINKLTKNEASRYTDQILFRFGK
ncbi:MAG TPA: 3'-5' exonuclease [Lachnospiraceae bacterium]|nr:3'-5' exonuclease [Lachnospiraceae bacterium]